MMKLRLIFWEATKACNLGCPHCRAQAKDMRSPQELSSDEAKRFIEEAAAFSKPILVFSGGEPLLREDIYEIANYAGNLGLKPTLATNATLINTDVAKKLKDSRIGLVAVSLYGASAASHDSFCGEIGAFEKTLEGIGNIRKAKINLQINTVVTKRNLAGLEAIGDFALRQGAVSYHIFFLVPTGRARCIEGDGISPQEYEEAFDRLHNLQVNSVLRIKVTCAPAYYRVLRLRGKKGNRGCEPDAEGFNAITKGCLAGQNVCFISDKGEVFGCGYLPVAAGNLREDNFKKIWFESELFRNLRDESNLQGKCGICEFKTVCGGCRARAFVATGNYLEEEPECLYQPLSVKS